MAIGEGAYRDVDDCERQDASRPAHVEAAEVIFSILVEQDAGDEKSGQNEEEINAQPAVICRLPDYAPHPACRLRRHRPPADRVNSHPHRDGDRAKTIKFRDSLHSAPAWVRISESTIDPCSVLPARI